MLAADKQISKFTFRYFHKPGTMHLYGGWILSSRDGNCLPMPIAFAGRLEILILLCLQV